MFYSHGTGNSTGVLICITEDLDYMIKTDGLLLLDIEIQSKHYVIINYYGNNDQHEQLETLFIPESLLDKINFKLDTKIILGDDFNVIFYTFLDADGGSPSLKTNSLNKISTLLSNHDLCDISRVCFSDTQRFYWRQKNPLILLKAKSCRT